MSKTFTLDQLPPFNEFPVCPKCGGTEVKTYFCTKSKYGEPCVNLQRSSYSDPFPEHLHRQCTRCFFVWLERPIDQVPPKSHSIQMLDLQVKHVQISIDPSGNKLWVNAPNCVLRIQGIERLELDDQRPAEKEE